jgi:hypothetical protein
MLARDGEEQCPGAPPALPAAQVLVRRLRVHVVGLTAEIRRDLTALADDLSTDAVRLQYEASARLAVVIARSAGCEVERPDV